nr:probable N-acetyltransferase 16 isoform X1 [Dasypus novemcinctus]
MKLETGSGVPTSQVPKPEKEAAPDAEPSSQTRPQGSGASTLPASGRETAADPRGAQSGTEPKAKSLGAKASSGSGHEAERLDFVVATEREFEEVLAISGGIYGGLDYLPSRYRSWLRDPYRTVVLAKRDGRVIALESVHVVDAGETALVEGLRVAPWERGKGVAGLLQRFCSQLVKRQHPGVRVARLTRDDRLGPRELKKYRLITKQVRRAWELRRPGLCPGHAAGLLPGRYGVERPLSPARGSRSVLGPFCPGEPRELPTPALKPSVLVTPEGWRAQVFRISPTLAAPREEAGAFAPPLPSYPPNCLPSLATAPLGDPGTHTPSALATPHCSCLSLGVRAFGHLAPGPPTLPSGTQTVISSSAPAPRGSVLPGAQVGPVGVKMPRGAGHASPPAARPALTRAPRRPSFRSDSTRRRCWRGWARGWRRCGPRAPSRRCAPRPCPRGAATWSASCCRPLCSATCFRAGPSSRTGSPTGRARATCACWRPRAWSGAWTAARARACSRCARPPSPSRTAATARGAASASTPSAATARRCRASCCGTCSARPRASAASTSCASSSWSPSCGPSWPPSARRAWGSSWRRVIPNSTCWRPTSEASTPSRERRSTLDPPASADPQPAPPLPCSKLGSSLALTRRLRLLPCPCVLHLAFSPSPWACHLASSAPQPPWPTP